MSDNDKPVAWMWIDNDGIGGSPRVRFHEDCPQGFVVSKPVPLYTRPQHSGMVSITVDCAKFLHDTLSYTTEEMWDAAVIERLYELNSAIKAAQEQQ